MSLPDASPAPKKLRVLNLEDNENDSELIRNELEAEWQEVELLRVETREAFVRALEEFKPDIALCDFSLPSFDGRSALDIVRQTHPDIPVIMVTGVLADAEAVQLVKMGARDYVTKDRLQRLASAVQGALSLEQGIRARKAAEKAVRQSEADIRAIIERSPVAMIVDTGTGADEKIMLMNQRFTELFGYTMEDIPDIQHWWPLAYPDEAYREKLMSEWAGLAVKTIQNHGDIEPRETIVTCKDGSVRHARISFSSTGSRNIVTFEDLTGIRKLEGALKESAYLNETIMSNANDAIVCINPMGIIHLWNRKAEVMFGYTAAEAIGQKMHQLITPERYRKKEEEGLQQFAKTGTGLVVGKTLEMTALRKGEIEFPIELSVSSMNIHGEWHATGIIRDITERKQAEADIRRLKELYAALSLCNQAIVRSKSETELFAQVCQIAVQFGNFKMAWIGLIDRTTSMVIPAASSGEGAEEYLHDIKISADACSEYGKYSTGRALCENRPFWNQHLQNSTPTDPWYERAAALGWRSSAALPLHCSGVVIGVFSLYADEANAFGETRRSLLIEMAADIDHALDNFSHEAVRRQAEESLRKLSLAMEQSPNSIVITDLDANLEYVNEAFVRVSGYSRAEAIGQNPRILQSGKTPRETYNDMWAHLTRGETWKGEFINRRKNGSEYIESTFVSPVRDADGRITHYIGIKEDITKRRQLEKQLAAQYEHAAKTNTRLIEANEQLERAKTQLLHTNELMQITDEMAKVGGLTLDIPTMTVEWSDQVRRIVEAAPDFNPTLDEAIALYTPESRATILATIQAAIEHGAPFDVEFQVVAQNERRIWVHLQGKAVFEDGRPVRLVGALQDITERKKAADVLAANLDRMTMLNEKLQRANMELKSTQQQLLQSEKMASIGLLAAGVAHEINNPVGYINSNLGTLEKYLADIFTALDKYEEIVSSGAYYSQEMQELQKLQQLNEKLDLDFLRGDIRSLLTESREGLERIKEIVLGLKDFSRSSADEAWQWADLTKCLESTLAIVWNELKYKCEVVREFGVLPQIYCLPSQLEQVFMNLLVNAAQAIETRGTVTIRTGQEQDRVWIEVTDTGSGIPPDILPRIFDPFFTTKPVGTGTGLGLPVSYGIIERHHGKIEVHSEVGKGSTFRVILPVQPNIGKEEA